MNTERKPNRLIHEKSPYLLQHAYNPVDWYPWGTEAFQRAKREGKPVFLSIGYSTCHWCHVMERESFEDEDVAKTLNEHFVSIKVDREERPDIDHVYMTVCQAMTGQGGWPLTVLLTPDQQPFFAGTYFPKEQRYGRIGLLELLAQVQQKWQDNRDALERSGLKLQELLKSLPEKSAGAEPTKQLVHEGYDALVESFDEVYGGFGSAPKFPAPHQLLFLMRYSAVVAHEDPPRAEQASHMVRETLRAMACGGIYDHIGGGFARYSTDEMWLVPHFEKMLYDNALLAYVFTEAFQAYGDPFYQQVAEETLQYLRRDLASPDGAFYAAEDADSEGEEGRFYLWTPEEVVRLLGEDPGRAYCRFYDIEPGGNFEGRSIPNRIGRANRMDSDIERFCQEEGRDADEWRATIREANQRLLVARSERIRPFRDDKVLTSWNALAIAAFAKAGRVFGQSDLTQVAERAMQWLETTCRDEHGRLLARYRDGEAAVPAYLDDYAYLAWACMELYEATWSPGYLARALELHETIDAQFGGLSGGGYWFTAEDASELIARTSEFYDGALPSGNSVAALNLIRLARLTADPLWEDKARTQLSACAGRAADYPAGSAYALLAIQFALWPTVELVLTGNRSEEGTSVALERLERLWIPAAVRMFRDDTSGASEDGAANLAHVIPAVAAHESVNGEPALYVCRNMSCERPVVGEPSILQRLVALSNFA